MEWTIDDRIILINDRHGACANNPMAGSQWACGGIIVDLMGEHDDINFITVKWDNGCQNVYGHGDLELENTNGSRCKSIW